MKPENAMGSDEQKMHENYMRMAMSLALRGTGSVAPNPKVGAVVVKDDKVVGWGFHRRFGFPHAEVEALKKADGAARGATLYVNLEPCCHFGKTPPCVPLIAESGISTVVYGVEDPNPAVSGKGIAQLKESGINVIGPILADDARRVNRGFIRRMTLKRPWVTLKGALSLDGTMALETTGESQWITGPMAREKAHMLRAEHDAILVGVGTVVADNPELTVRTVAGRSPKKLILDKSLRSPLDARVFATGNCTVFTGEGTEPDRINVYRSRDVKVCRIPNDDDGQLSIDAMLAHAAESEGVNSLLVEGGGKVSSAFLKSGVVDEVSLFIAPSLLGRGLQLGENWSLHHLDMGIKLKSCKIRQVGSDIWVEGRPVCSPVL